MLAQRPQDFWFVLTRVGHDELHDVVAVLAFGEANGHFD
jgi:hypothetical protein